MTNKEERLNLRIRPEVKIELWAAAIAKGLSISSFINTLAVNAIEEEKKKGQERFEKLIEKAEIEAEKAKELALQRNLNKKQAVKPVKPEKNSLNFGQKVNKSKDKIVEDELDVIIENEQ